MTATTQTPLVGKTGVSYSKGGRIGLHAFLIFVAVAWLIPIVTAVIASFRRYRGDVLENGVFSWPKALTLDNYRTAWRVGDMKSTFGNTMFIVIPSLFLILFLSSCIAFACTRFEWKFNIFFLILFTAGNLMPQQVVFQPLFQFYRRLPWPDFLSDINNGHLIGSKVGVILIHVALQTGFCTFVLSNYMKSIPRELGEAAQVDGAGVARQFFQIILPLIRPALAALGTLEFTWLYNDFFWGSTLISKGAERPITSSIQVLNGQYATDSSLIAAASLVIALPTLAVYIALQKQFIAGLTLGASKG
jgi:multiple sugar transport system permease protein